MIDLSLLAPDWQVTQSQRTLTTSPQLILSANPRRFCVILTYHNNFSPPDATENSAFLTIVDNFTQFGLVLVPKTQYTYDFTKYASFVQREFWARDSGVNPTPNGVLSFTEIIQVP